MACILHLHREESTCVLEVRCTIIVVELCVLSRGKRDVPMLKRHGGSHPLHQFSLRVSWTDDLAVFFPFFIIIIILSSRRKILRTYCILDSTTVSSLIPIPSHQSIYRALIQLPTLLASIPNSPIT